MATSFFLCDDKRTSNRPTMVHLTVEFARYTEFMTLPPDPPWQPRRTGKDRALPKWLWRVGALRRRTGQASGHYPGAALGPGNVPPKIQLPHKRGQIPHPPFLLRRSCHHRPRLCQRQEHKALPQESRFKRDPVLPEPFDPVRCPMLFRESACLSSLQDKHP